ncbi:hypothetical protein AX16_006428 [Volvariella volvacea WC 439]|nr:hypothetical protein AX16_006428 [Volvariella volvacea WC 439]
MGRCYRRVKGDFESVRDVVTNNTGLLLIMASQAFFSLMNVAVKTLNSIDPPVSTLQLIFVRMVITYICSMAYMLGAGIPHPFTGPPGVRLLLLVRGFSGFFGLMGIYFSLQYLSLSDATVLTFLAPLGTAISGAVFLGEKFGRKEALAGLISLLGVVLIARPTAIFGNHTDLNLQSNLDAAFGNDATLELSTVIPTDKVTPTERLIAVGVAMLGVVGATGAYTTLRAIGKRAHTLHSLVSFSSQCVIVSSIGMIATKTPLVIPTQLDWLGMLFMIGIFGFVAQVLLTMGLQREAAGRGTMAIYTQVIFATILERIFFHTSPPFLSIIGTVLILSSALYVALTKERSKEDKTAKARITLAQIEEEALEEGLLNRESGESRWSGDGGLDSQSDRGPTTSGESRDQRKTA